MTQIPNEFSAGSTVAYSRTFADYPASGGWSATLYLMGKGILSAAATANGSVHEFVISAEDTAPLEPGQYKWVERVSKAGEVRDVGSGTVTITPDPAQANPGDLRSKAEIELEIVEAAIAGTLRAGHSSYQIAGRAVALIPLRELYEIRAALRQAIASAAAGGAFTTPVRFTFKGA